ncbi:MAG: nucleotidyltransferase domain-containing protein [bacterium]
MAVTKHKLLKQIKSAVKEVEPTAEIWLYGSRARGDAAPDSDWDLLVVVDGDVDDVRERRVWRRLFDLELEVEEVLSALVVSHADWDGPLRAAMPLYQSVVREGAPV